MFVIKMAKLFCVTVFTRIDSTVHIRFKLNLLSLQARIKKIMQTDEEIGKVAAAVPVIICILPAKYLQFQGSDHLYEWLECRDRC